MGYRTGDAKTGSPRGLIGLLCKRYVHSELHAWAAWLEEGRTPVKAEEGKGQSADVQTFLRRLLRSVARSTRLKSKSIAGTAVSGVLLVACCVLLLHPLPRPLLVPFADSTVFTASVSSTFQKAGPNEQPKLIPRIVHQTFPSRDAVPAELAPVQQSWGVLNPGWQISFWDDALCREFVRKEFPEYFTAFVGLPKNVERADFFRYLVVLRHGGVYADIDAECMQPLDSFIRSADTLVAGWEGEVSDQAAVINRHFARHRQVQQWFFAAAPGHPALRKVCDHIAAHYDDTFLEYTNLDTLERTGPGAWTDAVLRAAREQAAQVATAVYPYKSTMTPGLSEHTPGILVLHHFSGTWKVKHGNANFNVFHASRRWLTRPAAVTYTPVVPFSRAPEQELYPVSVNQEGTVFTAMVHLIGHGDLQSHEDVSAALTRFGHWQAGMPNTQAPRASVALIGALGKAAGDQQGNKPALLDIGAGYGLYTLTAAARGHRVIATELAERSTAALRASIAANGFDGLVKLHNVSTGASPGRVCVEPAGGSAVHGWRAEEVQRGYAAPQLRQQSAMATCRRAARTVTASALVPKDVHIGAVRISASAWTGEAVAGALPLLRKQQPVALLLEVDMASMAHASSRRFAEVIQELEGMGYGNMAHAGDVCVKRFEAMLASLAHEHKSNAAHPDVGSLKQPTWCDLNSGNLADVLEQNRRNAALESDGLDTARVELFLLQLGDSTVAP